MRRFLALLAVVTLGCGDDDQVAADGGGDARSVDGNGHLDAPPDLSDLSADFADAICRKATECCDAGELADRVQVEGVTDYAGCRVVWRTILDTGFFPAIADSVAAGRARFDEAAFRACLDDVRALTCAEYAANAIMGRCGDALVGLVADQGSCQASFDCATGTCDQDVCIPKPGLDMPCSSNSACQEGLYCPETTDTCQPRLADDAACDDDADCQSGTCVGRVSGSGTCGRSCLGPGIGVGPPPDPALETMGARIVLATCAKTFACCDAAEVQQESPFMAGTEVQCDTLLGVLLGLLAMPSLYADYAAGTVTFDAAAFDACLASFSGESCVDYARDNGELDLCFADALTGTLATGAPCTQGWQCVSGFCQDLVAAPDTCQPRPGLNDPCPSGDGCAPGTYCGAGETCQAQVGVGETCATDDACAEGRCWHAGAGPDSCALVCDGT